LLLNSVVMEEWLWWIVVVEWFCGEVVVVFGG
jgi:hypothetical protein